MIQFNLLPDVKLDYIRAARTKKLVISSSFLTVAGILAIILILAAIVFGVQRTHLNNLNKDIGSLSQELTSSDDINKILTIQNQLNRLSSLHDQKPNPSRLFGYVSQLTPSGVTISNLAMDYQESTIKLQGAAPSMEIVNKYVDTIKFTTYKEGESDTPAFKEVVLSDFSISRDSVTYEISFKFDPVIFDGTKDVALTVPKLTTTRSEVEKPDALFKDDTNGAQ